MKTKASSIDEIRQQTKNLIDAHKKSIQDFHENHFPHLFEREGVSDEENYSEGYDEAAMDALEAQEKENTILREENARLRKLLFDFEKFREIYEKAMESK